jgi:hypothetical protein
MSALKELENGNAAAVANKKFFLQCSTPLSFAINPAAKLTARQ